MAKKKQYKKKAILRFLNNKTIYQAMAELDQLAKQGYGNCKISIYPKMWRGYSTGGVECKLLIPIEEIKIK